MNLQALFTANRGVSPVIGVILMVAITVILAAVIGAFVLGLGDQASSSAPQASFNYDFDGTDSVEISHGGGDNIDASTITISSNNTVYNASTWGDGETLRTGDSITIDETTKADDGSIGEFSSGDRIRIIWENPSGGSSNSLSERSWP